MLLYLRGYARCRRISRNVGKNDGMGSDRGACTYLYLPKDACTRKHGDPVVQARITLQGAISQFRSTKSDMLEQDAAVSDPGTVTYHHANGMRELQAAPDFRFETDITTEIPAQLRFHVSREPAFAPRVSVLAQTETNHGAVAGMPTAKHAH